MADVNPQISIGSIFERSRTTIGERGKRTKTLSRFRFLRICRRRSFADRLLGGVGHSLRYGLLDRALGYALLHGFPDRFFYSLCRLLFGLVIRHGGTLGRDLVSQLGIVHGLPFTISAAMPLLCLPDRRLRNWRCCSRKTGFL